ncbi:hypothetical protein ABW22_00985 [Thiobacillus denitrificans]|uniref:Uncharacterized protein n=1 Tax=Thiobacillus denitrificans TaxID=36861 RepID=A0A119CYD4_THIDE|nr:hypothetical protein ABW22_00985 [Thiobacillus denitrificans]
MPRIVVEGGAGGLDVLERRDMRGVVLGKTARELAHQINQLACRVLIGAEKVGRNQGVTEGRDLQVRDCSPVTRR